MRIDVGSRYGFPCTGPAERKAKNLAQNPNCVLTTGCNGLDGLDLVVEGAAAKASDGPELRSVADTFESKYGRHFTAPDGIWFGLGEASEAVTPGAPVAPSTAFGFGKGGQFSQTRGASPDRGSVGAVAQPWVRWLV